MRRRCQGIAKGERIAWRERMPQWIEAGVAQGDRLTQVLAKDQITTVTPNEETIAHLVSTLGWRAYVTNAPRSACPCKMRCGNIGDLPL